MIPFGLIFKLTVHSLSSFEIISFGSLTFTVTVAKSVGFKSEILKTNNCRRCKKLIQ